MKLDSEEQRQNILKLLGQVPVQTNLDGLLAGPDREIVQLIQTIQMAPLEDGTPSALMSRVPAKEEEAAPERKTPRRSNQKNQASK